MKIQANQMKMNNFFNAPGIPGAIFCSNIAQN